MKPQNKTINFPLFWKFAIISTLVVLIFGAINIYFLWTSVYGSFEKEIDKRCIVLAKITSEKALTPMLYGDEPAMHNVLNEMKQSDHSISYIFILNNDNELVAQTYDIDIPEKLLGINTLDKGNYNIGVINTDNFEYPVIRDIAYPILDGEVGTVRLGIAEGQIQQEINKATYNLILMIVSFLFVGLSGALFFSYIITSPIKMISQKAQDINLSLIGSEDYDIERNQKRKFLNYSVNDELDVLETKFSEMLSRLKISYLELKDTQGALIQAEKMVSLGRLSAGIAHEINNPISGIKNCINRINKNPQNIEQNINYNSLILEATERIENVVKHLLNFSRKQDIVFEKISLNACMDNAIKQTAHNLENNDISIGLESQGDFILKGSTNHLEQVFINLIINSLDAIIDRKELEPGHVGKLNVSIMSHQNKKLVIISIRDNGLGIPDSIRADVFDPFFTSKKVGKGTGLGLYLSFSLIKAHNGEIYFNSKEGDGTEFIIELPFLQNQSI